MSYSSSDVKKIRRTSAGAVVLRQENGQWHALLLRAWSHWDFPKGNVEQGESLLQAALREVSEETGITAISFPWGEAFARTAVYSKDKVAFYSIAETEVLNVVLDPNPQTGETEHDEYRWVPWSELPSLLSPRLDCILVWVSQVVGLPVPALREHRVFYPNMECVVPDSASLKDGTSDRSPPYLLPEASHDIENHAGAALFGRRRPSNRSY